jgi:2-methylcitrate dehydratase PrpD
MREPLAAGTIEARLADFAITTPWDSVPAEVRSRALDFFVDAVACAFTGRTAPSREDFAAAAFALTGSGRFLVIDGEPSSMAGAALLNAWQTTATTMCDVYRPAMCHVTPVVLSAALVGAQQTRPSLEQLLRAFTMAIEITVRLCAAMQTDLYRGPRWHAPGVLGPYGAATAAGLLEEFDAEMLRSAWGAAGLQSAGTFSAIGSPGVKFTQARAALAGVTAVELAKRGNGGSLRPLTHPDGGLFDAYGGRDPGEVVADLGERWELLGISLRRWPAASSLQSLVEAVLALRSPAGTLPARVEVTLPPMSFRLCAAMPWTDSLSALQSAKWVTAVVWTDGDCWTEQFDPARLDDPVVGGFARSSVDVSEDPQLPAGSCRVVTTSSKGEQRTIVISSPLGSPERPLSSEDVAAKLSRACGSDRALAIRRLLTEPGAWSVERLATLLGGQALTPR